MTEMKLSIFIYEQRWLNLILVIVLMISLYLLGEVFAVYPLYIGMALGAACIPYVKPSQELITDKFSKLHYDKGYLHALYHAFLYILIAVTGFRLGGGQISLDVIIFLVTGSLYFISWFALFFIPEGGIKGTLNLVVVFFFQLLILSLVIIGGSYAYEEFYGFSWFSPLITKPFLDLFSLFGG